MSASLDADDSLTQTRRRVSAVSLSRGVASVTWPGSPRPLRRTTHDALRARRHSMSHVAYRRRPARRSARPDGLVEEYLYPDPWATPPRSASLARPSRLLCKARYMPRSSRGNLPVRGQFFTAYGTVICRHCSIAPTRPFSTAPRRSLRLRLAPHLQHTAGGDHPTDVAVFMRSAWRVLLVAALMTTPLRGNRDGGMDRRTHPGKDDKPIGAWGESDAATNKLHIAICSHICYHRYDGLVRVFVDRPKMTVGRTTFELRMGL